MFKPLSVDSPIPHVQHLWLVESMNAEAGNGGPTVFIEKNHGTQAV